MYKHANGGGRVRRRVLSTVMRKPLAVSRLKQSGRPYDRDSEAELWQWARVAEHLSAYVLVRRVDQSGLVSLYNRGRYVGSIHKGKKVFVMYDPDLNES